MCGFNLTNSSSNDGLKNGTTVIVEKVDFILREKERERGGERERERKRMEVRINKEMVKREGESAKENKNKICRDISQNVRS